MYVASAGLRVGLSFRRLIYGCYLSGFIAINKYSKNHKKMINYKKLPNMPGYIIKYT
jgi:hypothetical protein